MKLRRGSVVVRRGEYAVVWNVAGDRVVIFPVLEPSPRLAGDTEIGNPAERLASGVPVGTVIRVSTPIATSAAGQQHVAELPGPVMCRVVHAVARVAANATVVDRWRADRRLREELTQCVKIVGD